MCGVCSFRGTADSDNEAADTCSTKHSAAGCQVNITYFRSGRRKTDLKLVIFIWINKL